MRVWVITQYGVPVAVFSDWIEAHHELAYLSFHGSGYAISKPLEVEATAGDYARGDQGDGPDPDLSNHNLMSQES